MDAKKMIKMGDRSVLKFLKLNNLNKLLFIFILFCSHTLNSQNCDCQEYIYLNDPPNSEVHKFSVDSTTGISEIGAPWAAGISQPHGLGVDLNGYLYIGEFNTAFTRFSINKLDCEGTFIDSEVNGQLGDWNVSPGNDFGNTAPYSTNLVSLNGVLYAMGQEKIFAIDLCTGTTIGCIGVDEDWGMALTNDNQLVLTDGWNNANNDLLLAPTDLSFYDASCTFASTFIVEDFVPDDAGNGNFNQVYGVTHADDGNYYVVVTENSTTNGDGSTLGASRIYRISPAGVTTLISSDTANDGTGFYSTRGIIYSEDTGYLFLSSYENCIYAMDLNGNPAPSQFINTTPGEPKALSIIKECCPNNTPLVYNETICGTGNGERIFLQDALTCGDGIICEGIWSVEAANANQSYNPCDLSITVNGEGCATYVLEKMAAATGAQRCGAFRLELEICTEVLSADPLLTNQGTCNGTTANNDASIVITGVMNGDEAGIIAGADYTGGPAYGSGNLDVSSGSGTFMNLMHNTPYTIRVFNGNDDCFIDYTVTTPIINCSSGGICDCQEMLYLNETSNNGAVHKYMIAADGTLTEIGNPWYSNTLVGETVTRPHGLGTDTNGFLYIGETDGGDIRKFDCDGNIVPASQFEIDVNGIWNMGSIGNLLYTNGSGGPSGAGIYVYDLCGVAEAQYICLNGAVSGWTNWGLYIDDNNIAYSLQGGGNSDKYLWITDLNTAVTTPLSNATPNQCYDAVLTGLSSNDMAQIGDMDLPGPQLMGVTADPSGNLYVIWRNGDQNGDSYQLIKYSPNGSGDYEVTHLSDIDNVGGTTYPGINPLTGMPYTSSDRGFNQAIGVVYSSTSDLLYVSTESPIDDCVATFDTDLNYLGAAVPFTNNASVAKGIAIADECCPTPATQTIDQTYCAEAIGDKLFLNEIFPCNGIICGAEWSEASGNMGMTYDPCDQSITITTAGACGTFTKMGFNAQCGNFNLTYNLCIEIPMATLVANEGTCTTNGNPNSDATISINNGMNIDQANYSVGAIYTGPTYGDMTNINVSSGNGIFTSLLHNSQYTIRVFNGANDCYFDQTITTPDAGCCPMITNPSPAQTICEEQIISNLTVNTNTSSPNQIEFVYFPTLQTGNAMYTGGISLGLVTPMAGSASISNINLPNTGTNYIYAILNPIPSASDCRPFQEIQVTVNPLPDINLMVSDPTICQGEPAPIVVFMSEIGVTYQLRNNADNSLVGSPILGNGGDVSIPINDLIPNNYVYNILATNGTTGCQAELTDRANVTINNCDFPDFPPPICIDPACHVISPDVYFGAGVTPDPPGNGDTNANTDVDDGISFPNNIRRNIDIRLPITFYNNTGNPVYIQGWIDWDGDTNFAMDEQIANLTTPFDGANLMQTISHLVYVPTDAVQDDAIAMRWRISSDPIIIGSPCGLAACAVDGEVEDYLLRVECPEEVCLPIDITIIRN